MQTQTSNTLHNAIMEAGSKDCPPMLAHGNYIQWKSRIKRYINTKPNHELIHYCLENPPYELGIDNDIYSTVDACPNACEMWKAIERLKQSESIIAKILKPIYFGNLENLRHWMQIQELKNVSYHKLYDIFKQHQHEVNEIQAEKIARVDNPLALVAQQQQVYHPQTHLTQYNQNSSTRTPQAATRNKGKALVNSPQPIYDQEPSMVDDDDEMSKDKEIDKLMALISMLGMKVKGVEYGHVARECQKPKKAKDAVYHREKMLLCKQEKAGIQLNAEQADWKDDTDDESDDQELEAHYMYMAKIQKVSPDAVDTGPVFDKEPEQKVQNDDQYD
nr:hypothetical protein [Tanacetum cinerariifolium]